MAPTLLETFRVLAAFSPAHQSLADAPWGTYVDWAIANGLGPLAAYNLEYRLAGGDAPEWVRDKLLTVYQGTVNDNVLKLVNFKRLVDRLEGRKLVLIGGAAFADTVYPHIGFRPVVDISVLASNADATAFASLLSRAHFKLEPGSRLPKPARSLSDGRTSIHILPDPLGPEGELEFRAMLDRALPMRAYGPSFFHLTAEDAVLSLCREHAWSGYEVPYISFVDLRELLFGASSSSGQRVKQFDVDVARHRAHRLGLDRALYASCGVVAELFPTTEGIVESLRPRLNRVLAQALDRILVHALGRLGRMRQRRGANRLRSILTGPRIHG